ncbi:MAG TPA: hypothetical protein PKV16_05520 [Caldisericia bacterium]|nr:hypothetical protein [Caldisericia bacterium]HPF48771.1 hypothetical protein [Caldisericia bacterium]HPI83569.1 hypothetical protein [Caldisericia bacterium]HPQ93226.1 hypothetical protein [Caldisericia bacterium]HRV74941.1 hypothetical protein [Caldisericia bacterium]
MRLGGTVFLVSMLILASSCSHNENSLNENIPQQLKTNSWSFDIANSESFFEVVNIADTYPTHFAKFTPMPFEGSGQLQMSWKTEIGIFNVDPSIMYNTDIIPLEDFWVLIMTDPSNTYSQKSFLINPKNGETKLVDISPGVSDGETIWMEQDTAGSTVCWNKTKGNIWLAKGFNSSEGLFHDYSFEIAGGRLLLVSNKGNNRLHSCNISTINPITGIIEKSITSDIHVSSIFSTSTSNLALLECYNTTQIISDNISIDTLIYHYFVLDTYNLETKEVFVGQYLQLIKAGDSLFAYEGENLHKLSDTLDTFSSTFEIGERLKFDKGSVGNYFLAVESTDSESEYLLINYTSGEVKPLTLTTPQIINGILIENTISQIRAIDPDTFEPIWWIDLSDEDLGNNLRVIWCDWRGVLVMSDTKLVCYDAGE